MKGWIMGGALLLSAATAYSAIPVASPFPAQGDTYTLRGSDVGIWNLAGNVTIGATTGRDVLVDVTPGGSDAERLQVQMGRIDGVETLRVVYPATNIVYGDRGSTTSIRVADDGTFGRHASSRGERIRIRGSGDGLDAFADLAINIPAGQSFSLYLGVGTVTATNVDGTILLDSSSGGIRTSGTTGSLSLDSGSGAIAVEGARGPVRVDTGSGVVDVSNIDGPLLTIDTGSGEVTAQRVNSADVVIDTGSGRVRAADIRARSVHIDTGSGGVELALLSDVEDLVIDTGSGGVTIDAPDDLGARIFLDAGSGGIDVDLPLQVERMDRDELVGTIGDGSGRIVIDTGSGGIRIR